MIIEMVAPALVIGGMEVFIERLCVALRERGHDVGVSCLYGKGPVFERLKDAGFDVSLTPVPGTLRTFWPRRLVHRLRMRRAEVVHAHSGSFLKAAIAARLAGCPTTVLTHHGLMGDEGWYEHWHLRQSSRLADSTVAVSAPLRAYLGDVAGISGPRLLHIANGVDLTDFARQPQSTLQARATLGLPEQAVVACCVARLVPVKRHDLLLQAFDRVARQRPDFHLLIAGDGPLATTLQEQAAGLASGSRVRFLGAVADPRPVLWASDLFVLCSDSEGQPMALLEAMAAGCAPVISAVGGMPDTVGPDGGVQVAPGNLDVLAREIEVLVTDALNRQNLAECARRRSEVFDFRFTVSSYEGLYGEP
ncbi:MAG: glycosyltransferase [Gemmatimonadaceae bacterium]|nr:glycosyltransferase [Gemmatimonadaceae bacterium]